jgi:hypothetical protein
MDGREIGILWDLLGWSWKRSYWVNFLSKSDTTFINFMYLSNVSKISDSVTNNLVAQAYLAKLKIKKKFIFKKGKKIIMDYKQKLSFEEWFLLVITSFCLENESLLTWTSSARPRANVSNSYILYSTTTTANSTSWVQINTSFK